MTSIMQSYSDKNKIITSWHAYFGDQVMSTEELVKEFTEESLKTNDFVVRGDPWIVLNATLYRQLGLKALEPEDLT